MVLAKIQPRGDEGGDGAETKKPLCTRSIRASRRRNPHMVVQHTKYIVCVRVLFFPRTRAPQIVFVVVMLMVKLILFRQPRRSLTD